MARGDASADDDSDRDRDRDGAAIRAVVEAYATGIDARRPEAVAALFLPQGLLVTHLVPGADGPGHELAGRERIAAALRTLDRFPETVHDLANHRSEVHGDRARATTACFAHHLEPGANGTWTDRVVALRYHDDLVRTVDGWRLARRELRALWVARHPVERG